MADDGFASRAEFSRGDEDIFTLIDKPGYRQRHAIPKKQTPDTSASEDLFAWSVVPDLFAGVAALPAVPAHVLSISGNGVAGNFLIPADMPEMVGSRPEKITGNIDAIVLAQRLAREGRGASRDEQTILARYVGWGGLRGVFDPRETGATTANGKAQARLRELLTPEDYRAAAGSTEDAFFTGRTVVAAMWAKMRDFGFTGGRALEPSAGIGAFLGHQPADLAERTEWYASELDKVSSLIAGLLYPDAVLRAGEGFEAARFRLGSMDIAIGNPPYSARTMQSDLHTDIPPFSVHNFMVAKSAMLLREGGIMGFVVTHRFMDRMTAEARSFFARHLNFLGAVRLPDTLFADAGTRVTTDIVFFQKRAEGKPEGDLSWLMTDVPFGSLKVNGYFAKHPDMMLGRPAMDGHRYSADADAVFALHDDGRDLVAALAGALAKITGMLPPRAGEMVTALLPDRTESDLAIGESILLDDGRIMMRGDDDAAGNSIVTEVTPKTILGARTPSYLEVVKAARVLESAKATPEAREASEDALQEAIKAARVYRRDGAEDPAPSTMAKLIYTLDPKNDKWTGNLSKTVGELEDLIQKTALGASRFARLKAILSLRHNTQALIRAEHAGQRDMEQKRIALRQQYREFVKSYGYLSNPVNDRLIDGKPGAEAALEIDYKPANKARGIAETAKEATILHKRVILPPPSVTSASSPEDGVHISMRDKGRLDLAYVAQLTGRSIEDVTEHLTGGTDPMVFFDPANGAYVLADEYLSGNIAQKIQQARKAKQFGNIRHLEDAMPTPKVQAQIIPTIRSLWLPESVFRDFLAALGDREAQVTVNMKMGKIFVAQSYGAQASDYAKQFATARKTAFDIFRAAASGTMIVIYDKVADSLVKNERETQFANSAVERMADEFSRWAYVNPERADRIVAAFNEKVNVVRTRSYSGTKYFRQVGADPGIPLRTNQKDGAWRMMVSQSTLLHHAVGVGKTYTAIAAIMERKRLGLSNKAAVAVPKHVLSQWARSWYALYPAANILVADERDFNAENRRKLIARIATGDYDGILIGHTSLKFIENEPTDVADIICNQIQEFEEAAEEAKRNGESGRTVAAIAKRAEKLHERLTEMEKTISRDRMGFSFTQIGIDYLVVDESQEYKNLEYTTATRQLVGMNNPVGSQRAFDMFIKVRGLLSRGFGVAFLSGTPISNSLVEIYVIMKYLAYDTLKEMGLLHYDAWASTFVEAKIRFEYTATGRVMERNVLSGLINLGPLSEIYKSFTDIILRKDMIRLYEEQIAQENRRDGTSRSTRFPVPRISGGGRQLITIPPSPDHEEYTSYLVRRMNGIKRNTGFKDYPKIDNPLWVLTDARKASIDIRTVDPHAVRHEHSKVVRAGQELLRLWKKWDDQRGTQLVFCDGSVPCGSARKNAESILRSGWQRAGLSAKEASLKIGADKHADKLLSQQWNDMVQAVEDRLMDPELTARHREGIELWLASPEAQDGASEALTGDTGFSFYDDLRAYLVENGMPAEQIAFIHDYSTVTKKSELFAAVNNGDIRILIGSTSKMGAGTNVQERLVGLIHADAPFRPSDMEQREGRIDRQGNVLYLADPDNFEVEILALATEKSSDVVMFQILARKAAGIEAFLTSQTDRLEEVGNDADGYAQFMAQSTGNPIYLEAVKTENRLRDLTAEYSSRRLIVMEAEMFVSNYETNIKELSRNTTAAETLNFQGYPDAGERYKSYVLEREDFDKAFKAHHAKVEEIKMLNANRGPENKRIKLPTFDRTRPEIMAFGKPIDSYTRTIHERVTSLISGQISKPIRLESDVSIEIDGGPDKTDNGYRFIVYLVIGSKRVHVTDIRNVGRSSALLHILQECSPEALRELARIWGKRWKGQRERMIEGLPAMETKVRAGLDRTGLDKAERDHLILAARVKLAEIEVSLSRAGKVNRFVLLDSYGRDLEDDLKHDKVLVPKNGRALVIEHEGVGYTAPFGAYTGWEEKIGDTSLLSYWFEASPTAGWGTKVLIRALVENTEADPIYHVKEFHPLYDECQTVA